MRRFVHNYRSSSSNDSRRHSHYGYVDDAGWCWCVDILRRAHRFTVKWVPQILLTCFMMYDYSLNSLQALYQNDIALKSMYAIYLESPLQKFRWTVSTLDTRQVIGRRVGGTFSGLGKHGTGHSEKIQATACSGHVTRHHGYQKFISIPHSNIIDENSAISET